MTKKELLERLDEGDQIHIVLQVTETTRRYEDYSWTPPGKQPQAELFCVVGGFRNGDEVPYYFVEELIDDDLVVAHPSSADVPIAVEIGSQGLCLVGRKWAEQKGLA